MLEPRSKRVLLLDYATTSAALKLLLLRRTLRKLGRSDFDAGLTTEPALFATQVPAALTIAAAAAGDSLRVVACADALAAASTFLHRLRAFHSHPQTGIWLWFS